MLIDPKDYQPATGWRPCDHLIGRPVSQVTLDPPRISQNLVDLVQRDSSLRMILAEMLPIRVVPDDRSVVHPFSIYEMDRRQGRWWDDFGTALLNSNLVL